MRTSPQVEMRIGTHVFIQDQVRWVVTRMAVVVYHENPKSQVTQVALIHGVKTIPVQNAPCRVPFGPIDRFLSMGRLETLGANPVDNRGNVFLNDERR
jgi:hypothetical protein